MGLSASGTFGLFAVALLYTSGVAFTSFHNGTEAVTDAHRTQVQDVRERRDADFEIANVTYDAAADTLAIDLRNTGAETLSVSATDVIVDGEYIVAFDARAVDGTPGTDIWHAGETLHVELTVVDPTRLKVVVEHGIAASASID